MTISYIMHPFMRLYENNGLMERSTIPI